MSHVPLAMTKQLTVVAEPSITRIAISSLSLNPKATAMGRNTATKPTSLINVAANAGFAFADAFQIKGGTHGHKPHRCCHIANARHSLCRYSLQMAGL